MEERSTPNPPPARVSEARFNQRSEEIPALLECKRVLHESGYHVRVIGRYLAAQWHFLAYLAQLNISPQAARVSDVAGFLRSRLREYCTRHGHPPRDIDQWRTRYTAAIHRLLRIIQGQWPPDEHPLTESERFQQKLLEGYGRWLTDVYVCLRKRSAKTAELHGYFCIGLRSARVPSLLPY